MQAHARAIDEVSLLLTRGSASCMQAHARAVDEVSLLLTRSSASCSPLVFMVLTRIQVMHALR